MSKKKMSVVENVVEHTGRGLGFVGQGLAYARQIPLLGPILVAPPIFTMREIVRGHDDRLAQIEAARALKAKKPKEAVKAAKRGVPVRAQINLRKTADRVAAARAGAATA